MCAANRSLLFERGYLVAVPVLLCLPPPVWADERLERIIANVRAYEEVYQDIEVVYRYEYRLYAPDSVPDILVDRAQGRRRSITQGPLLYFREDDSRTLVSGASERTSVLVAYDGEMTRSVAGNIARVYPRRVGASGQVRAHTLLVDIWGFISYPLSLYLRGGSELQNHPSYSYQDLILVNSFEKEEIVDGLRCIKIRCEYLDTENERELIQIRYVWLVPGRNYLPIKMEGYSPRLTRELPLGVVQARDWRQVEPEIWLPFEIISVVYEPEKAKTEKQLVTRNTTHYFIEKVDLNPNYDISFFRDIPIPDGTLVYEIGEDNKIARSYIQGYVEEPKPFLGLRLPGWLLMALGNAVLLLAGLLIWWWRRRNRAAAVDGLTAT